MIWALLLACGAPTYIVEGTVVEVGAAEVVIDHREIEGFMGPMVMPFEVVDRELLSGLEPGQRVIGRIRVQGTEAALEKLRVVGHGPVSAPIGPAELQPGEVLPAVPVVFEDGSAGVVGAGQGVATRLTFLFTRCADATFCPATVSRLQALPEGEERVVAVTLDPERDVVSVLAAYAEEVGATSWRLARTEPEALRDLAMRAGLSIAKTERGEIVHGIRWLELDAEGRLVRRHDDNAW